MGCSRFGWTGPLILRDLKLYINSSLDLLIFSPYYIDDCLFSMRALRFFPAATSTPRSPRTIKRLSDRPCRLPSGDKGRSPQGVGAPSGTLVGRPTGSALSAVRCFNFSDACGCWSFPAFLVGGEASLDVHVMKLNLKLQPYVLQVKLFLISLIPIDG